MTLRSAWEWTVDYWQGYYYTVTNISVFDWPILYIVWTVIGAVIAFYAVIFTAVFVIYYLKLDEAYQWVDKYFNRREYSWLELIGIYIAVLLLILFLLFAFVVVSIFLE